VSISPVSDIILDVARAADPVKARSAAAKLTDGAVATTAGSGGVGHIFAPSTPTVPSHLKDFGGSKSAFSTLLDQTDARTRAYKGLEQLVLKNLVENMLPKQCAALFGSGTAGDIWRSLLADQLATEIGKAADLGAAHQYQATIGSAANRAQTGSQRSTIAPASLSRIKNS